MRARSLDGRNRPGPTSHTYFMLLGRVPRNAVAGGSETGIQTGKILDPLFLEVDRDAFDFAHDALAPLLRGSRCRLLWCGWFGGGQFGQAQTAVRLF